MTQGDAPVAGAPGTYVEAGRQPRWTAAVWSGVLAGAVFALLQMLLVAFFAGQSPWTPFRMIAAILLGPEVLPPPESFELGIVLAAMMVHFALSIVMALILAYLVFHLSLVASLMVGVAFGVVVYVIDFYLFPWLFPWFALSRNWITVVSHLVFGLVLAGSYKKLARREIVQEAAD